MWIRCVLSHSPVSPWPHGLFSENLLFNYLGPINKN